MGTEAGAPPVEFPVTLWRGTGPSRRRLAEAKTRCQCQSREIIWMKHLCLRPTRPQALHPVSRKVPATYCFNQADIFSFTAFAVKPNFSQRTSPGAEAP